MPDQKIFGFKFALSENEGQNLIRPSFNAANVGLGIQFLLETEATNIRTKEEREVKHPKLSNIGYEIAKWNQFYFENPFQQVRFCTL